MRSEDRTPGQARKISIISDFTENATSSVLISTGRTKVLCTVSVEDTVPGWMRNQRSQRGWLTAEYSMLPGSTETRSRRETRQLGGRTQEIQRLIGRSLRSVFDMEKIPEKTFIVDCDVLQADGGTRTASITGAYVALAIAVKRLMKSGKLKTNPIANGLAAVSVGIINDEVLVDLDYKEDSSADLDMNVVMTDQGQFCELQGTAEKGTFSKDQVNRIIDAATASLEKTFLLQNEAIENAPA